MSTLNILILCKKVPYPSLDGESIVIMSDIRHLRALGHQVHLFCLNTSKHPIDDSKYTELNLWDSYHSVKISEDSIWTLLKSLSSRFPFHIARFYRKSIQSKIQDLISLNHIDLILCQGLAMTQYTQTVSIKSIYRVHNLEHNLWKNLGFLKSIISKSLANYESRELNHISQFIALNQAESDYYSQLYSANISTIQISINTGFSSKYDSNSNGLLFVGSLDWQANREGLDWFIEHIYSHISDIPMTIAGRGEYPLNSKYSNIKIISNFDRIEDLFATHRLMIVPLLSGAGIRIKILEAIKYGMPTISTQIGAEGILTHPQSILISDNISDWISKIKSIYSDNNSRIILSHNAKQSYKENYSEESILSQWKNAF